MTDSFVSRAEDGEVVLNNFPLLVNGQIIEELQNIFGRKVQQGDPGPDDHPVNSTISQEDNTGGIGVLKRRSDEDLGRCWWSTAYTQARGILALHPATQLITVTGITNETVVPIGRFQGLTHIVFGQKVKVWNEVSQTADNPAGGVANTAGNPVGRGIAWGNSFVAKKLYIPCGATYETYNGTITAAGVGGEGAISFAVWSQKLFKLDSNGVLKFTIDNVLWQTVGQITTDLTPYRLFIWTDESGREAVFVSTSGNVYALDFTNSELVETDFKYPDHPQQGRASTAWHADAYVSVGAGVHRDQGGFVTAIGLDGRDGLPQEYAQGFFNDFAGGYNELYGVYMGTTIASAPATETADQGINQPEGIYAQAFPRKSFITGYNILGWTIKSLMEDTLNDIVISSDHSTGVYRWFVGGQGKLYTQIIPIGYWNPRYNDTVGIPLNRYAEHITPFYNWGWLDTPKILKQIEMKVHDANDLDYIVIWIRKDIKDEWGNGMADGTPLAIITDPGQFAFSTGQSLIGDQLFFTGLEHEQIQLRFELFGNIDSTISTPVIEWYAIIGRKWMRPVRVWTFQVNATLPYKELDEAGMRKVVFDAATKKGGVTLTVGDQTYVVDVTSDISNRMAGTSETGYINVTCVEWTEALVG